MKKILSHLAILTFVFTLLSCTGQKSSSKKDHNSPPLTTELVQSTKGNILAELNGQPVTEQDILPKIKSRLSRIENQLYDLKRDAIDQIIEERLLDAEAKKRNTSIQELIKVEIQEKVGEISDKEIEEFYNQNKPRFGERKLEELKPLIAAQLKAKKSNVYRNNLIDRLMAKADVDVYISRPTVEVGVGKGPSKGGPTNAPVVLIEFTDYQCPFCARARPAINEVIETYKNNVHYVIRNFPLDFHNFAKKAAVAALCANEQGKYWDYGTKLWENQRALDVPNLKKYASDLKLDTKKFDECLDTDKYLAEVNQDMQDGMKAGVSGTPAFFVNGKMISGAQPFESFKKMIDEELREVKRKKS